MGRAMDDRADGTLVCRFGLDCKRPGCKYEHPEGRKMDGALPQTMCDAREKACLIISP